MARSGRPTSSTRGRATHGSTRTRCSRTGSLADRAADRIAERVLEAIRAAVWTEAPLGLRQLSLAVEAPGPRRARLPDPRGAVDRYREEEEPEHAVRETLLGEADHRHHEDERGHPQLDRNLARVTSADLERLRAEEDEQHHGTRNHRGVDRRAALLRPIHVVEVDPQGELVDGEAGTNPEQRRAYLEPRALVEERETERPGPEHQADAPDQVVKVHAAVAHDASRPPRHPRTAAEPGAHPDEAERQEEGDQYQEEPLPVMRDELVVPEVRQEGRCGDAPSLTAQLGPEQGHGLRERGVGRLRVIALAHVAAEGVLGVVLAPRVARSRRVEPGSHRVAARARRVRVASAPDQVERTVYLACPGQ